MNVVRTVLLTAVVILAALAAVLAWFLFPYDPLVTGIEGLADDERRQAAREGVNFVLLRCYDNPIDRVFVRHIDVVDVEERAEGTVSRTDQRESALAGMTVRIRTYTFLREPLRSHLFDGDAPQTANRENCGFPVNVVPW
jgi:hypothetical protein